MADRSLVGVEIELNFDAIARAAHSQIRSVISFVATSLTAIDSLPADTPVELPGSILQFFDADKQLPRSTQAARVELRTWLLGIALSELINRGLHAIEDLYSFSKIATAGPVSFADSPIKLSSESDVRLLLESLRQSHAKQFNGAAIPARLDLIEELAKQPLTLKEHVLSINRVRNCLTHRGGVVGDRDARDQDGLEFRHLRAVFQLESNGSPVLCMLDGKPPESLANTLVEPKLRSYFADTRKIFKRGETVTLTTEDIAFAGLTLHKFVSDAKTILTAQLPRRRSTECQHE